MLLTDKKKSLEGIKRLRGLLDATERLIDNDAHCPDILANLLAMHGHVKFIQGTVLESHLRTCAGKNLMKRKDFDAFVMETVKNIGLSCR